MNKFVAMVLVVLLSACGGGGSTGGGSSSEPDGSGQSSSSSEPTSEPTPEPEPEPESEVLEGGPPDEPTNVSLNSDHMLSTNSFYNYFSYEGSEGDKLVIYTLLSIPLSDTQKSRCGASPGTGDSPSSYETQIHIYDKDLNRVDGICGQEMIFSVPEDGLYILNFEFPSNGGGVTRMASVSGDPSLSESQGPLGSPSNPSPIDSDGPNQISTYTFFNYYYATVSAGDKIIIDVELDDPLSEQQKTRCASSPGTGDRPSAYDTQIHIYDSDLNRVGGKCGEDLTFEFSESGSYFIQFDYAEQSQGEFNAAFLSQ
jgi:hypothetical protein